MCNAFYQLKFHSGISSTSYLFSESIMLSDDEIENFQEDKSGRKENLMAQAKLQLTSS